MAIISLISKMILSVVIFLKLRILMTLEWLRVFIFFPYDTEVLLIQRSSSGRPNHLERISFPRADRNWGPQTSWFRIAVRQGLMMVTKRKSRTFIDEIHFWLFSSWWGKLLRAFKFRLDLINLRRLSISYCYSLSIDFLNLGNIEPKTSGSELIWESLLIVSIIWVALPSGAVLRKSRCLLNVISLINITCLFWGLTSCLFNKMIGDSAFVEDCRHIVNCSSVREVEWRRVHRVHLLLLIQKSVVDGIGILEILLRPILLNNLRMIEIFLNRRVLKSARVEGLLFIVLGKIALLKLLMPMISRKLSWSKVRGGILVVCHDLWRVIVSHLILVKLWSISGISRVRL